MIETGYCGLDTRKRITVLGLLLLEFEYSIQAGGFRRGTVRVP